MEQQKNSLSSAKVKIKKKALSSNAIRKAMAVLLGIMALLLAVIMVICNTGILFKMIAGIASIYIFWFAIDYYHEKCPKCMEKVYITRAKDEFHCPRCGWPKYK